MTVNLSMSSSLRYALTGSGQQLVACAELLLARGHQIVGILSDSPEVIAWARGRSVAIQPRDGSETEWLVGTPFDYLLSIINHEILPPELVAAPIKRAINYHDSLLPQYAGFNATSWAILDGKSSHGVTWHEMTEDVDGGGILLQRAVEISDDDTAFTLGVKCSEAGIESFATLLGRMEKDSLRSRPQQGRRSFHLRSDRPGTALMNFSRPAAELNAMVRALNFGPEDNWMAKPKLRAPGGYLCVMESRVDAFQNGAPGTVLSISNRGITIAARDGSGALNLSELATLNGEPIDPVRAATRFGITEGTCVPPTDGITTDEGEAFDAQLSKSERFWVKRLGRLNSAALPDLAAHQEKPRPRGIQRAYPVSLAGASSAWRAGVLVAALSTCLKRLGGCDGDEFDLGAHVGVPDVLRPFYSPVCPLRCKVGSTTTFRALVEETVREMALVASRGTYAKDVLLRYQSLRGRTGALSIPIGVWWSDTAIETASIVANALREGTHLTLVTAAGAGYAWVFDEAAIPAKAAHVLAERFDVLLDAALRETETPVHLLPLLARAEREQLLTTWQVTKQPYESDVCVHEHFERQVERTPDAPAIAFGNATLTYRELNQRANAFARRLRAEGVGPEVLVGICVERSIDMMVALLGILKAGGAYVPLDPAYPRDRLAIMLEDSKAPIVVTQRALRSALPASAAKVLLVDEDEKRVAEDVGNVTSGVKAGNLAYVIFTSGSTGRPKGTMLEHRNVSNFFAGMDAVVGRESTGAWLAVTSISFDISVLELFWTIARGFKVIIAPETDRASIERRERNANPPAKPVNFGLFYFSADSSSAAGGDPYRLLIEGAKFADENGFTAVWTPERHFHAFGGLYPNPAVTTAALSTITKRIHLRAGSVVLPLHNPMRVAEDWAVIDQLSGGRVGLSFASGWHVNDFAFMPDNFERRREVMLEYIDTVLKLWRGEKVAVKNGAGATIEVSVLPRPVQERPPLWLASAGSVETFALAGRIGANVLTNMLGQDLADLRTKFEAYRTARRAAGHEGDGIISVMMHTFVCGSTEEARRLARKPFSDYLASSFDLVKVAPKMFPAFRQPSRGKTDDTAMHTAEFSAEDMEALLEHAFDRYFETAGLFGTPERAREMVERLAEIGATEMACLIDFGIDPDLVLQSLPHLHRLQELCKTRPSRRVQIVEKPADGIAELILQHNVTHLQCTPSMARVLAGDPDSLGAMAGLQRLLVGGEALPADLGAQLSGAVKGDVLNMYGPTETTVWSTTSVVSRSGPATIGRPIANTTIRILDEFGQLVPVGVAGELCIGGAGVARGYLGRSDLTTERFVPDPYAAGERIYRTGDLARYRPDGEIEFLGRIDHQVKISGHRIEPGEIESALARHAAVRQSVVVARNGDKHDGNPLLVAYVVLSGNRTGAAQQDTARVADWQTIWEATYQRMRENGSPSDARFRIDGWNDSYSGEPIPRDEMREWLDTTVQRILSLGPKQVLEIGCGAGLILYRLLPHLEHYTGVDISRAALAAIQHELTPAESAKVTLLLQPAHALEGVARGSCDTVVLNSVVQYFPDADYLRQVLQRAADLVADGGHIFVGDVRSLAHLDAFYTSVELSNASGQMDQSEVRARVQRRAAHESELALSEEFFRTLVRDTPRLSGMHVELKRGRARNELTRFRYDVVLHVQSSVEREHAQVAPPVNAENLDAIRALLANEPPMLSLASIPNARLTQNVGVDPEQLYTVNDSYDVQIRWASSGDPTRFDALLRHSARGTRAQWPPDQYASIQERTAIQQANTPVRMNDVDAVTTELRSHLEQSLPDYMVPATFVVMESLPLTPNGKIDRKALPDPVLRAQRSEAQYVPPTNDMEEKIAGIWRVLLDLERVGRQDNIFDLGANSLLTMQANNRLSSLLGRKVSLVSMFRYPSVASLATHLGDASGPGATQANEKRAQDRASRAEQAAERRRALRAGRKEK